MLHFGRDYGKLNKVIPKNDFCKLLKSERNTMIIV